jgi:SRSO17 transposase
VVAAGHSVEPGRWQAMLDELLARVAGRFGRVEPRRRVRGFVLGLLADLPRKNCWTIAEHAGDATPDGMQHLLGRAVWDTDGVRDDLRDYVTEHLGDPGAVLVVDETGDIKKGTATVGVQRQYTGTAGRVENAQVAVYLTYAGQAGHAMIDRELYLPKSWTSDPARCARAGVPEDVKFATKPQLARVMITRALDAGVPARWAAGDEVYGADPALRAELEARQLGYVLAIGCDRRLPTAAGPMRADTLAATVPPGAWARLSAGRGAKGHRYYDWAWVSLTADSGQHWLLIRRHLRHVNSPSTAAIARPRSGLANWSGWLVGDGLSRRVFRPAKAWPGSMNTRFVAGWPGGAGPCWPCSPTPCSRSSPQPNAPSIHHPRV